MKCKNCQKELKEKWQRKYCSRQCSLENTNASYLGGQARFKKYGSKGMVDMINKRWEGQKTS